MNFIVHSELCFWSCCSLIFRNFLRFMMTHWISACCIYLNKNQYMHLQFISSSIFIWKSISSNYQHLSRYKFYNIKRKCFSCCLLLYSFEINYFQKIKINNFTTNWKKEQIIINQKTVNLKIASSANKAF